MNTVPKMNVADASGRILDLMVAMCEGIQVLMPKGVFHPHYVDVDRTCKPWCPSICWEQGGLIMDRQNVGVWPTVDLRYPEAGKWSSRRMIDKYGNGRPIYGDTPLVAAMRCYVISKYGETVTIADDLYAMVMANQL